MTKHRPLSSKLHSKQKTDLAYVATHGFAARMIVQTDLLGRLVDQGRQVALIVPDANDAAISAYCHERGVALHSFVPPRSRWQAEYFRLRKYLLDDISANPPLLERHHLATRYASRRRPWAQIRPRLYMLAHKLSKVFPGIRSLYQQRERRFLMNDEALELIAGIDPLIFVSTYPVNFGEGMLLSAARRHGCLTVIHLLSWDNISGKGTFPELADKYLLWGNRMAEELKNYYSVSTEDIRITGVPHFDLHVANRAAPNPEKFLSQLGLNPKQPYLFFGMSSAHFAPGELDIVSWLAEKIRSNHFGPDLQLVIRPHPQNLTGNWSSVDWLPKLKSLAGDRVGVDFPDLVADSGIAWSMRLSDMQRLSQLIAGSSLVYNSGSTISIDAMMCDVPVIMTSFDGNLQELDFHKSARRLTEYIHLKALIETGSVEVVRSFDELNLATKRFLENPAHGRPLRLAAIRHYCDNYDEGVATQRVVVALEELFAKAKS